MSKVYRFDLVLARHGCDGRSSAIPGMGKHMSAVGCSASHISLPACCDIVDVRCAVKMLIAYPIGLATGALIPPEMVDHTDGRGIDALLLLQFGMAASAAVVCFFLSSAPPSAPSATAPYRRGNDNLGRDLKSLRRNFGFMTLCNIWGLSVGAIQVLPAPSTPIACCRALYGPPSACHSVWSLCDSPDASMPCCG